MKKILALDLEGTLISNALPMDCTPRPGLWDFLSWARRHFRVVLYTNVFPRRTRASLRRIVQAGHAPAWLAKIKIYNPENIAGEPQAKDLRRIGPVGQVVIVDDTPRSILEEQRHAWLPIESFWGEGQDNDLKRIEGELSKQVSL